MTQKKSVTIAESDIVVEETSGVKMGAVFWLFAAVSLVSLVLFCIVTYNTWRNIKLEQPARGYVVDFVTRYDSEENTTFYYPVVEYYLPDGNSVTVTTNTGSSPPTYRTGQPVDVLYLPDDPQHMRIKSTLSLVGLWTLSIISGVFGIAFFGAAWLIRWLGKPD